MTINVIACLDRSQMANHVTDAAVWVSETIRAPLKLVHVHEGSETAGQVNPHSADTPIAQTANDGEALLNRAYERIGTSKNLKVEKRQFVGELVDVIADLHDETRVLVVGKHGELAGTGQLGNHLTDMIRASQRPTLIVTETFSIPRNAMLAFDGSKTTMSAVNTIANSPLFNDLEIHVVMVGAETEEHQKQLAWAKNTLERNGVSSQAFLVPERDVGKTLDQHAHQFGIQMMIMGAYTHTQLRRLMRGSHTTKLLEETSMTLLVLR